MGSIQAIAGYRFIDPSCMIASLSDLALACCSAGMLFESFRLASCRLAAAAGGCLNLASSARPHAYIFVK